MSRAGPVAGPWALIVWPTLRSEVVPAASLEMLTLVARLYVAVSPPRPWIVMLLVVVPVTMPS